MSREASVSVETGALPEEYLQRFGGVGRLLGRAALPRLRAAHVCIVGIGGVGSWVVEALARSGIGALTLVDADDVCVTNTNRQLPALADTVGRPKVAVMAERVAMISPSCRATALPEFLARSNADALLDQRFDLIVDCVDRAATKAFLIHACRERGMAVLTSGAAGGRRNPASIRAKDLGFAGNDELLREVRRKLRGDHGWPRGERGAGKPMGVPCVFSTEKPVFPRRDGTCSAQPEPGDSLRMDCASGLGSVTFVTGAFGFMVAGEAVQMLLGDDVAKRPE
jgi:tRNA A37 threonylcarbamoyladenosine dehydratase